MTKSKEGKEIINKWKAYLDTGEAKLPFKDTEGEPDLIFALDQYADAYGFTDEELEAWLEDRKKRNE